MKLFLGLGLIFSTIAHGAVTEPDRALVERARNLLSNGGFESSTATWSATGGTAASVTATANVGLGNAALSWDASAASQILSNTAVTIPSGLYAANGLARCMFKTTATDYVLQAYDGTNVLASATIPATTQYQQYGVNFPFPSSGSVSLRVVSASNAAVIYMDDCYVGPAANLQSVNQAQLYGSIRWAVTAGCEWTTGNSNNTLTDFAADTDCPTPTVSGYAKAPSTKVPRIEFDSLPPGQYMVISTGFFAPATGSVTALGTVELYDGTSNSGTASLRANGSIGIAEEYADVVVGYFNKSSTQSNVSIRPRAKTTTNFNNPYIINSSADQAGEFRIDVYRFPSTSELAYRPDQVAWRVDANISGANPSLGTAAVSSYTELTNGSLVLTQNSGSIATQIACASGTASSGTTCTAANESVGIVFTTPTAGDVLACVNFSHQYSVSVSSQVISTFQIVETTNTSSAIVQEGNSKIQSGTSNNSVFQTPYRLCGTFKFASAGQKTLRLQYEQATFGTVFESVVAADASGTQGQRDIHWEVYPITQSIPAPLLVGSVTSSSSGLEKLDRVAVSNNGTCSITSQSSTWTLASTTPVNGGCTLNISGYSAAPTCSCTANSTANINTAACFMSGASTSTISWRVGVPNGAYFNEGVNILCQGPR